MTPQDILSAVVLTLGNKVAGIVQRPRKQSYLPVCAVLILDRVQTKVWMLILGGLNVCTDVGDCDCTRELFEYRKRVSTEKPMLALRAWIFWSKVLPPELSQTPEHFIIIYPSFSDKKGKILSSDCITPVDD